MIDVYDISYLYIIGAAMAFGLVYFAMPRKVQWLFWMYLYASILFPLKLMLQLLIVPLTVVSVSIFVIIRDAIFEACSLPRRFEEKWKKLNE